MSAKLNLLGGFQLVAPRGRRLELPGTKARLLLAYIALSTDRPVAPERLEDLFWPDRDHRAARVNLRQALTRLRRALPATIAQHLESSNDGIGFAGTCFDIDVGRFEALSCATGIDELRNAASRYRGEFLKGLWLDGEAVEEWLRDERERLRTRFVDLLIRLAGQVDDDEALERYRQLLQIDPYREDAHLALMRLYAKRGDAALALGQYEICRLTLARELGIRPAAALVALRDMIQGRRGDRPVHVSQAAGPLESEVSISVAAFGMSDGATVATRDFAAGLQHDLVVACARFSGLRVLAAASPAQVPDESGMVICSPGNAHPDFKLVGMAQEFGKQFRVSLRVARCRDGEVIWADRFDGRLGDGFAMRDELANRIAATIHTCTFLSAGELGPIPDRCDDPAVLLRRASRLTFHATAAATDEARELSCRVLSHSPRNAVALRLLANCHYQDFVLQRGNWIEQLDAGLDLLTRSIEHAPDCEIGMWLLGNMHLWRFGDHDRAYAAFRRSNEINPNHAMSHASLGHALITGGEIGRGIRHIGLALRTDPRNPLNAYRYAAIGLAHFVTADYPRAANWSAKAVDLQPNHPVSRNVLVASLALQDRIEQAGAASRRLANYWRADCEPLMERLPMWDGEPTRRLERGLRLAGTY